MAGKYKRGNTWTLSWVEDGRQIRRSLGQVTETEAEAARLAREGVLAPHPVAGQTFAAWAERYAEWHASEYPDSYYRVEQILRSHLIPAFGPIALMGIDRAMVEAYKSRRLQTATPGTVVKELRTLQAAMNAAVAWDVIPRNPVAKVRAPRDLTSRPPRWYTREELALIYACELEIPGCTTAVDAELHRRYRWTWQLLCNTGLRRTEALQLQWRDVGREEIGIRSEEGARTKSGRWRSIPLSTGARQSIEALQPAARQLVGHVLPQVAATSLSRAFARTLRRSDLDGHIHCLRHTYCSHLVQAGVPLRTVQVLAGHASGKTTERYAHLAPSTLRDAIAALDL